MTRRFPSSIAACIAVLLAVPSANASDAEARGPLDAEALMKRFVLVMPTPSFDKPQRLLLLGFRYGLSGLCGMPASFAGMPNPPDRDESASIGAGLRYAGNSWTITKAVRVAGAAAARAPHHLGERDGCRVMDALLDSTSPRHPNSWPLSAGRVWAI